MSKQPPPATTASAVGPCPTLIQISRTPRHWKFTQHHRTTRPPPQTDEDETSVRRIDINTTAHAIWLHTTKLARFLNRHFLDIKGMVLRMFKSDFQYHVESLCVL